MTSSCPPGFRFVDGLTVEQVKCTSRNWQEVLSKPESDCEGGSVSLKILKRSKQFDYVKISLNNITNMLSESRCMPSPIFVNATVTSDQQTHSISISCKPGHVFADNSRFKIKQCQGDGTWSSVDDCGRKLTRYLSRKHLDNSSYYGRYTHLYNHYNIPRHYLFHCYKCETDF